MNLLSLSPNRLFSGFLVLALALSGLSAGVGQAQVAVPRSNGPPTKALVKPNENVLPQFQLGAAGRMQREIVALTNQARQQAGLKPLQVKRVLTFVAERHALNMAFKDTMSHNLDGKGVTDRLKDAKYNYSQCGENIAFRSSSPTAQEVFKGWMDSEGHRNNILNPKFTEMSIGTGMNGKTLKYYFCQVFGTPQ